MCIFRAPVEHVSGTSILVSPTADGKHQLTVYENVVALKGKEANAMILPVPLQEGDEVTLIDLSKSEEMFVNLKKCWSTKLRPTNTWGAGARGGKKGKMRTNDCLEVVQCGSYKVSIVPSLEDIDRLDEGTFTLASATEQTLKNNYAEGFGFVVAKFETSKKMHPLGYVSPLHTQSLFVPTRHEHGDGKETKKAHWDHTIWSINTQDSYSAGLTPAEQASKWKEEGNGVKEGVSVSEALASCSLPETVSLCKVFALRRLEKQGKAANTDLSFLLAQEKN